MKKRLLAFLVTVFTLICMALPAYAEEGAGTPPLTTQVGRTVGTGITKRQREYCTSKQLI